MLTNINVLIIGGDSRYLEIINDLSTQGATIYLAGYDKLTFTQTNVKQIILSIFDFSILNSIILPVSGCGLNGEIDITYSDEPIHITSIQFEKTKKQCVIYTGSSNSFLVNLTNKNKRKLVSIFDRDDVAILNSIPTAEATLKLAIEKTDITIHGSNVIVFGFGRVGMTIARLFSSVGSNVSVCVRKSEDIARIIEMGLTPIRLVDVNEEIFNIEICINTVPHPLIDQKMILEMRQSAIIIDVASSPGGTDFPFANKQGIETIHALGLPGKTAPKTAGKIMADVLIELLLET